MDPGFQLQSASEIEGLVLQWQQASPPFAALIARYGAPAPALRHLGLQLWEAQNAKGAAEAFSASLALSPDDADLWRDLAFVHDGLGDPRTAHACITKAIALAPGEARSWLLLAGLERQHDDKNAAVEAYGKAIALDSALGDAHFGLGLLRFEDRRYLDAVASLQQAVDHGYAHAVGYTSLGHALYMTGSFPACAAMFEAAAASGPLGRKAHQQFARARTFAAMIDGQVAEAVVAYPHLADPHREDLDEIMRDAFSLLSAHGHFAAALEIGRMRLDRNPDDPIQRYLMQAVGGTKVDRAPPEYVERFFDRFAAGFDDKLVGLLGYDVPAALTDLVAAQRQRFESILDLGCGTGLAATSLARFEGRLSGVDLSARMLAEAEKRGFYAGLEKDDAVAFLERSPDRFDLIFSADVLIYFGDLGPIVEAVWQALVPNGIFAFSLELTDETDYAILPSGRFAHSQAYAERLLEGGFAITASEPATIRLEANDSVRGLLVVARRTPAPAGFPFVVDRS